MKTFAFCQFHNHGRVRVGGSELKCCDDVIIDHPLGGVFCAGAHVNNLRFRIQVREVEVQHVFEAACGCDVPNPDDTVLAGTEFLERLTTVETEPREAPCFCHAKRELHVSCLHAEQRLIDQSLASESRVPINFRPSRTVCTET